MAAQRFEIWICVALGGLLMVGAEVLFLGPKAAAYALFTLSFVLVGAAMAALYWTAPGTRLARWAAGLLLVGGVGAAGTSAFIAYELWQRGTVMEDLVFVPFFLMLAGFVAGAVGAARSRLLPGWQAALVPVTFAGWPALEAAFPAWGGVAGASIFAAALLFQMARQGAPTGGPPAPETHA